MTIMELVLRLEGFDESNVERAREKVRAIQGIRGTAFDIEWLSDNLMRVQTNGDVDPLVVADQVKEFCRPVLVSFEPEKKELVMWLEGFDKKNVESVQEKVLAVQGIHRTDFDVKPWYYLLEPKWNADIDPLVVAEQLKEFCEPVVQSFEPAEKELVQRLEGFDDSNQERVQEKVCAIQGISKYDFHIMQLPLWKGYLFRVQMTGDVDPLIVVGQVKEFCRPIEVSFQPAPAEKHIYIKIEGMEDRDVRWGLKGVRKMPGIRYVSRDLGVGVGNIVIITADAEVDEVDVANQVGPSAVILPGPVPTFKTLILDVEDEDDPNHLITTERTSKPSGEKTNKSASGKAEASKGGKEKKKKMMKAIKRLAD